jgi:peptide deformylase
VAGQASAHPAEPVGKITDEIRAIWDDMIDTMEAMPGVGLAAPQIGVMLRLAVVDCSTERGKAVRMADPEILTAGPGTFEWEEGSPNLPGVSAKITRPSPVSTSPSPTISASAFARGSRISGRPPSSTRSTT